MKKVYNDICNKRSKQSQKASYSMLQKKVFCFVFLLCSLTFLGVKLYEIKKTFTEVFFTVVLFVLFILFKIINFKKGK